MLSVLLAKYLRGQYAPGYTVFCKFIERAPGQAFSISELDFRVIKSIQASQYMVKAAWTENLNITNLSSLFNFSFCF
jgi:hypothetical protein